MAKRKEVWQRHHLTYPSGKNHPPDEWLVRLTRGCIESSYNDPTKSFNSDKMFRKMANVLVPKTTVQT